MKPCATPGESAFMPGITRAIAHHYPTLKKIITSAIKYSHIGDFVIYSTHGKDRWTHT
jgi:hypothetical protein